MSDNFELEMLESILQGIIEAHPDELIAETARSRARAFSVFLKQVMLGQVHNVDVSVPVTTGYGYINKISSNTSEGRTIYFARVSLITGRSKSDGDSQGKFRFQYLDLVIDNKLRRFAENFVNSDSLAKQLFKFSLANCHFEPELYNNKPILNSTGYLKSIEFA